MLELDRIYNMDCIEGMKQIDDKSIDMILCDLPYGITRCSWDSNIPLDKLWDGYKRIIKDNGSIVLTASQPFTSALVMSNLKMFKYEWIWDKGIGSNPLLANKQPMKSHESILVFQKHSKEIAKDLTTFKELREYALKLRKYVGYSRQKMIKIIGDGSSQHFLEPIGPQWNLCTLGTYKKIIEKFNIDKWSEYIEWDSLNNLYIEEREKLNLQKEKGKPYICTSGKSNMPHLDKLEGHITKNKGDRFPKTIIKVNPDRGLHPTQKPVKLFEYLIKTYSNEGNLVLDNCMGSGTTAVACKQLNRHYIGFEINKEYYDISLQRLLNVPERLDKWIT